MKTFLSRVPGFICCYRALASLIAFYLGPHPLTPWLFATALISDLFDGWFYRRYVRDSHPTKGPSPDCLADLTLVLAGSNFILKHFFHISGFFIGLCELGLIASAGLLFFLPEILPRSTTTYTICLTTLTHLACFLMILPTIFSCYLTPSDLIDWQIEAFLFLTVFYFTFLVIGDKSRLIRRPPTNWRT